MTKSSKNSPTRQETTELESLVPHRAPMLLIDRVISVSAQQASAQATIDQHNLFFIPEAGVPAWTGLEMMGQTAALMAGFQQRQGLLEPQTGFLLGSRRFQTSVPWFKAGQPLQIDCNEGAAVGDNLATFECSISKLTSSGETADIIATALLSVYRQPAGPAE